MKDALKKLAAVIMAAFCATASKAGDRVISIVAQEMPGLIEPGGKLPYNRLLNALTDNAPIETRQTVLPGYRGVQDWLNKKYDCIFGGISSPGHQLPPNDTTITQEQWNTLKISSPFNILRVRAVSAPGTSLARSMEVLEDRAVAIDEILFLDLQLHTNATSIAYPVKVPTAFKALDLLRSRRVAYALAYDNDIALYRDNHPQARLEYDQNLTILELEESMMCWPVGNIDLFIAHTNRVLRERTEKLP